MTPAQRTLIFTLANERRITKDQLYGIIKSMFKKDSVKDLNKREASVIIDLLKTDEEREVPAGEDGAAVELATQAQLDEIYKKAWELNMVYDSPPTRVSPYKVLAFAKRTCGKEIAHLQWLSKTEAQKVLNGMKAVIKRGGFKNIQS